jgi:pilus biogenesis lipoprotein CpaD
MKRILPLLLLAFTACERADYQWMDPQTYNETLYPKKVKVTTDRRSETFTVMSDGQFDDESLNALHTFFGKLPRAGVESMVLTFGDSNEEKQLQVIRTLRKMGFQKRIMKTVVDTLADPSSVKIDLQTAVAVVPDCPDWRKSNTTNYSNTIHSNMNCASATNLGRMVANPRDIERNNVQVSPDGTIDASAIGAYRGDAAAASVISTSDSATSKDADTSSVGSSGQ